MTTLGTAARQARSIVARPLLATSGAVGDGDGVLTAAGVADFAGAVVAAGAGEFVGVGAAGTLVAVAVGMGGAVGVGEDGRAVAVGGTGVGVFGRGVAVAEGRAATCRVGWAVGEFDGLGGVGEAGGSPGVGDAGALPTGLLAACTARGGSLRSRGAAMARATPLTSMQVIKRTADETMVTSCRRSRA